MESSTEPVSARDLEWYDGEIARLTEKNLNGRDPEVESALLELRHHLGIELIRRAAPTGFPEPAFELVPDGGIPEFTPDQLTPEALRAAILTNGFALVRGLVDKADADGLVERLETAFEARERHKQGSNRPGDDAHYDEFAPEPPYQLGFERTWVTNSSGVWTADCPSAMFDLMQLFERVGLRELAASYLGEPAVISVNKCTLRKIEPYTIVGRDEKPASAWHQDGAFLGDVSALNVWLALTDCGEDAPGLDLVPRRLDYVVPTGTEGAEYDWSLSLNAVAEAAGDTKIVRPVFEAGDVMLFDELFLHSTATEPDMPHTRYAAETWFFGPSKFPEKYTPMAA